MILFKKATRYFYTRVWLRFFLFYLPNIFNLKRVSLQSIPFVQQKILVRGLGDVFVGKRCSFGFSLGGRNFGGCIEIQPRTINSKIIFGDNIETNNNLYVCASSLIKIGSRTLIGERVTIMDFDAHGINPSKRKEVGVIGEVIIGENVWIGNNVTILKNSHIGDNTIIAAGAVVSGNFPDNVIIGGIPARIIKKIEE